MIQYVTTCLLFSWSCSSSWTAKPRSANDPSHVTLCVCVPSPTKNARVSGICFWNMSWWVLQWKIEIEGHYPRKFHGDNSELWKVNILTYQRYSTCVQWAPALKDHEVTSSLAQRSMNHCVQWAPALRDHEGTSSLAQRSMHHCVQLACIWSHSRGRGRNRAEQSRLYRSGVESPSVE